MSTYMKNGSLSVITQREIDLFVDRKTKKIEPAGLIDLANHMAREVLEQYVRRCGPIKQEDFQIEIHPDTARFLELSSGKIGEIVIVRDDEVPRGYLFGRKRDDPIA